MEPALGVKKNSNLLRSFRYAFEGMWAAIKTETNWKIGLLEAVLAIIAGLVFNITRTEWFVVILLIGIVLYAELCNSAIEAIVDSFTTEHHPGAKIAKDFSAGSVVIIIITSGVIGLMVFWPYLKSYFFL